MAEIFSYEPFVRLLLEVEDARAGPGQLGVIPAARQADCISGGNTFYGF